MDYKIIKNTVKSLLHFVYFWVTLFIKSKQPKFMHSRILKLSSETKQNLCKRLCDNVRLSLH